MLDKVDKEDRAANKKIADAQKIGKDKVQNKTESNK
jgi:hypothetical protein